MGNIRRITYNKYLVFVTDKWLKVPTNDHV